MKKAIFWILLLCRSISPPVLAADEDPFDILDAISEGEKADQSIFGQLRNNAEFKLFARSMTYYRKPQARPGIDNRSFAADARLEFKTDFTRGRHEVGLSAWGEYGSQKDTYSQREYFAGLDPARPDIERKRRYVELNELYWISSWGDVDLTVGKKRFPMGLTPFYSPIDRIGPGDFNDPFNLKRYGLWQLAVDYYWGEIRYTLALFPVFIPPKLPGLRSRWLPNLSAVGTLFSNIGAERIAEDVPRGLEAFQALGRIKTTYMGWDFSLDGFTGVDNFPVLREGSPARNETSLVREYIRVSTVGFGFSTTAGKFEFHGDGLFRWSQGGKDDDTFVATAGVTYRLGNRLQSIGIEQTLLTVDYGGEVTVDRGDRRVLDLVPIGENDLLVVARLEFNPDFILSLIGSINLNDRGSVASPMLQYQPWAGVWLTVSAEFFLGKDESFYGNWKQNNRLITSLDYSF